LDLDAPAAADMIHMTSNASVALRSHPVLDMAGKEDQEKEARRGFVSQV